MCQRVPLLVASLSLTTAAMMGGVLDTATVCDTQRVAAADLQARHYGIWAGMGAVGDAANGVLDLPYLRWRSGGRRCRGLPPSRSRSEASCERCRGDPARLSYP